MLTQIQLRKVSFNEASKNINTYGTIIKDLICQKTNSRYTVYVYKKYKNEYYNYIELYISNSEVKSISYSLDLPNWVKQQKEFQKIIK